MGNYPRRAATARAWKALHRAVARSIAPPRSGFSFPSLSTSLIEPLEMRQMLSVTVPASRKAAAKLGTSLNSLYQSYLHAPATATDPSADSLLQIDNGSVELENFAKAGQRSQLVAALKRLKATNIKGTGRETDALVPIASLGRLAKVASLRFIQPAEDVVNTGSVTSQGDVADQGASARSSFGITGAGVKVGIVSDSFNTSATVTDKYANDVATGDLPANVQILNDGPSIYSDEGRAMAQVIYDTAPGATLAFSTAEGGVATMAASIKALTTAGAKVIVDDFTYLTEPMFQDGTLAQAVNTAVANGVEYISAAGNNGTDSYASSWRAGPNLSAGSISNASGAPYFYGGTAFTFSSTNPNADLNSFTLGAGQNIRLSFQWDSPYYSVSGGTGTTNQLDAYVLNAAGTQVVGGANAYVVGGDPIQTFQFTNTGSAPATYNLMLVNENIGATPGYIKYVDFSGQATNWTYAPNSSTIFGHANAAGSETIGAVSYANTPAYGVTPPVLESYSGTGGTPILFNSSGGRYATAITRQEPELVAPDNVYNTFFGTKVSTNVYTFSGTSAAAASAAGVAALAISKSPLLTPAQVNTALQNKAVALTSTTPNLQSGYGLIQATASILTTVVNITGSVFFDSNGNGALDTSEAGIGTQLVYIDLNKNGIFDPGEPVTTTASNGTYAFYNQTAGSVVVRVVPPTGYVVTQSAGFPVTIVQGTTKTNVNLGLFPDVFTNTNPNIAYTLRTNASIPADVDIITVSTTYTVPLSILPSLTFNLTGSGDTVNVNFSAGSPIPVGGLLYTAGGLNNSLIMTGTTGADNFAIYGSVTYYNSSSGVISTVTANNIQSEVINGVAGNDNFSVETAQPVGESLTFNGSNTSVVNDTLTIDDALPNNGKTTYFNPGTNAGDINALNVNVGKFTFNQNPASTAANLTVNVQNTANGMNIGSGVIFTAAALGSGINVDTLAGLIISTGTFNVDPDNPLPPPSPNAILAAPASHADRTVLVVGQLSVTGIGQLDLNANDMIVTNSSIGAINPMLTNGFAGGSWNGTGGIISSAAANDTTHLTALGSLSNNNAGSPFYSAFDGQTVGNGAVLIKYTYYGDADLSGVVDASDYSRIDNGYVTQATGWANGDFNYDNVINGSDYTLIDNAFNTQGSSLT